MNRRAFVLGLLLACATAPAALALQVKFMGPRDLVAASAVVVRARVLESRALWRDRDIVTDASVEVLETLVGRTTAPVLTVRQLGGKVGDAELHVAGVRYLRPGEEVLLFLRTDGARFYLVGFSQGSLFLETEGGQTWVRRETAHLELVVTTKDAPVRPPSREPYAPLRERVVLLARELGR